MRRMLGMPYDKGGVGCIIKGAECKYKKTTVIQGKTLGIQRLQVFLNYTVMWCVAYDKIGVGCIIKGAGV